MQTRQILIANNKTQRRYTIQSSAETLGQLKSELTAQGIDYNGMIFTEGISKLQLVNDDSALPTNVMYKGQPTNNLVMLLTNSKKQIASGAYPTNRKEFGAYIKQNNLGDAIKAQLGDNWTRISTPALISFFQSHDAPAQDELNEVRNQLNNMGSCPEVSPQENKESKQHPGNSLPDVKDAPHANTINWFYDGIKAMQSANQLFIDDIVVLANLMTELAFRLIETRPSVTDEDVDNMFRSL